MKAPRWRAAVAGLAWSVLAVACGGGTPEATPTPRPSTPAPTPSSTAVPLGPGVTREPCPDALDATRGCVYLGGLSDISEGPFAALGASILRGAQAFWDRVDAQGGLDGRYEVDLSEYVRDTRFDPEAHAAAAAEIAADVVAVAVSLGTEQTLAALTLVDDPGLLFVPGSFWSGWAFDARTLPSGYSYCVESMGALDWYASERGPVDRVMSIHHGDLYGRDSEEGVARWATASGVAYDRATDSIVTPRTTAEVGQDDTVATLVANEPDVVVLATGPVEAAEIVAKARAEGTSARFLGSVPTWNPVLLESRAGEALQERYEVILPWQPWGGTSVAHEAMLEALDAEVPSNEGFVFGWLTQYPLLEALQVAVEGGGHPDRGRLASGLAGRQVSFEGGAPPRTYGGDPTDIQRHVTIAAPGEGGVLGSEVSVEGYLGPSAAQVIVDAPCAGV